MLHLKATSHVFYYTTDTRAVYKINVAEHTVRLGLCLPNFVNNVRQRALLTIDGHEMATVCRQVCFLARNSTILCSKLLATKAVQHVSKTIGFQRSLSAITGIYVIHNPRIINLYGVASL